MNAPSDTAHFALKVLSRQEFKITPATLPDATIGRMYFQTLEVTNGTPPLVWGTLGAQRLPAGLTTEIIQKDGRETLRFTGTATAAPPAIDGVQVGGLVSFLVTVSDAQGRRVQSAYSIRVVEAMSTTPMTRPSSSSKSGGCGCATTQPARARGTGASLSIALLAILGLARRAAGPSRDRYRLARSRSRNRRR